MAQQGISLLKFVGTASLGLLTGVSFSVPALTLLPTLRRLPSSAFASLAASLRRPVLVLASLAAAPLLLAFALSPRSARHPYLVYASLLAALSAAAAPPGCATATPAARRSSPRRRMEASYDVLGDSHSEGDLASEDEGEHVNGEEEVRLSVEAAAKAYVVRTGLAALGFAMAIVGLWGDGAPQAAVAVA